MTHAERPVIMSDDAIRAALAAIDAERAAIVAVIRDVIAHGYDVPARKVDKCEHDRFGWEDCIACYDEALEAALCQIERGEHLTQGEGCYDQ